MRGLEEVVTELAAAGQLVHLERIPARPARIAELAVPLPNELAAALPPGGLWTHQAQAIDLARAGRSLAVATGTASGKSLCYQVPIADEVIRSAGRSTALLVYPTKALAQDQLRSLAALGVGRLV